MKYKQNEVDDAIEIEEIHIMCFSISDRKGKFDVQWLPHIRDRLNTSEFKSIFSTIDQVRLNVIASLSKARISRDVNLISAIVVDCINVNMNYPLISKKFQELGF